MLVMSEIRISKPAELNKGFSPLKRLHNHGAQKLCGITQECSHCVPHNDGGENGDRSKAAVEVVTRTGYGEAVRVFDLGPRDETMGRGPGDRIAGRTCEGDCNHETGPLPHTIARRPT